MANKYQITKCLLRVINVGLIPEELVEEVRSASDIVSVISDFVALKKKGNRFWGLCPFHHEDTPSFSVNPEKDLFYCFGCNTGGNVFKFIMLKERLNFPEAVRYLADRSGVVIPDQQYLSPEQQQKERAYQANDLALKFYQHMLLKTDLGQDAREYIRNRGLTKETVDRFAVGFAPPSWNSLTNFLMKKGYSKAELVQWGLAVEGRNQSLYDRFRNRVIFPIINVRGKVVGFGGRVMDDGLPKYLNSAESEIFNKAANLYGLNLATSAIRDDGQAVIVEGYLDVIAAHQAGISNVVASLGTAMTRDHAQLLMRLTKDVILAYDADPAGQKAALRGLDILQEAGCRVKVLTIPEGKDPDEFIRLQGADQFRQIIATQAQSLIVYKMNKVKENHNLQTTGGKLNVLAEVMPNLVRVRNEVELEEYLHVIGTELNLSWETIQGELRRFRQEELKKYSDRDKNVKNRYNNFNVGDDVSVPRPQVGRKSNQVPEAVDKAEESLIRFAVEKSAFLDQIINKLGIDAFRVPEHRKLFEWLIGIRKVKGDYTLRNLDNMIEDGEVNNILARIVMSEMPMEHPEQVFSDCLNTLCQANVKRRKETLLKSMAEAEKRGDLDTVNQLLQEIKQLM